MVALADGSVKALPSRRQPGRQPERVGVPGTACANRRALRPPVRATIKEAQTTKPQTLRWLRLASQRFIGTPIPIPGVQGQRECTALKRAVSSAMIRGMKRLLIALAFAAAAAFGWAQAPDPKRTPIEEFHGEAIYGMLSCQIEVRKALAMVELREQDSIYTTLDPCIDKAKGATKKLFPAALARFAKKPESARLLKDYYAAWLRAMDALRPAADETMRAFQARQAAAQQRAEDIWARFEIEAGL